FSSRRRHTRSKRDWSSDVCSSDLATTIEISSENNSPITFNKESTVKLSIFKLLHLLCTTLYQYDIAFQFVHVYNIKSIKRTINWTSFIIQKTTRLFHLYLFMYDINFPSLVYTGLTFLFISSHSSDIDESTRNLIIK